MNSRFIAALVSLSATLAYAGESAIDLTNAGMPAQCAAFGAKVSSSEGNWGSINQFGCLGAFQFCPGTFQQYYSGSAQSFLDDPKAQVAAWTSYEQSEWTKAQSNGLTSLIGTQVCTGGSCFTVSQSSILMACQFGCGANGKLANFAKGGDCTASNVLDGNGVSVCSYLQRGAGYDASCFTRQTADCFPGSSNSAATPAPGAADATTQ